MLTEEGRAATLDTISAMMRLTILTEGQLTYLRQLKESLDSAHTGKNQLSDRDREYIRAVAQADQAAETLAALNGRQAACHIMYRTGELAGTPKRFIDEVQAQLKADVDMGACLIGCTPCVEYTRLKLSYLETCLAERSNNDGDE